MLCLGVFRFQSRPNPDSPGPVYFTRLPIALSPRVMDLTTQPPNGCGPSVQSLYFNLCDLEAAWGIVVEAFAAAGVVGSFMLLIIQMASLPFVPDKTRKSMTLLQVSFLVFTLGLFGLSIAFIVGRDFTTCMVRRFLFGVLFAGCFSCLLMHGLWLVLLERQERGPRGWLLWLGAVAVWLVEVIINTEWMIITVARDPDSKAMLPERSCRITNKDFVMALIYVMVLLVVVVLMAVPSLTHKHRNLRRDAIYILMTGVLSMSIWVTWIVMYIHGNQIVGDVSWDDPTLAIALVSNGWVFLILYTIPEICLLSHENQSAEEPEHEDHMFPTRGVVYENILRRQTQVEQNMYIENKAFTMDEPSTAKKLTSPYSGYNGQLRSCVYQPTELALISKGLTNKDFPREPVIPRASAPHLAQSRSSSLPKPLEPQPLVGMAHTSSGNGLHRQW
ncbi:G-protein coupled receptor family C group 5 member C-like isoform X1 [Clupea harengus]|uniref:G-protein coupled receptor family C group 5 member C-like isoform X1 n=2 Tax=Clupea harengus TaxID=7950 RepID=A0A8M1KKD8_CLUHA|nr:G-protein coupled receptor family C group 5 member C-like isoform X1 [Clupea harengus]XP_042564523.1 G-protein coupled receptor family C group 5 member C-like isoform X1 [Clupea harengus]